MSLSYPRRRNRRPRSHAPTIAAKRALLAAGAYGLNLDARDVKQHWPHGSTPIDAVPRLKVTGRQQDFVGG